MSEAYYNCPSCRAEIKQGRTCTLCPSIPEPVVGEDTPEAALLSIRADNDWAHTILSDLLASYRKLQQKVMVLTIARNEDAAEGLRLIADSRKEIGKLQTELEEARKLLQGCGSWTQYGNVDATCGYIENDKTGAALCQSCLTKAMLAAEVKG